MTSVCTLVGGIGLGIPGDDTDRAVPVDGSAIYPDVAGGPMQSFDRPTQVPRC